MSGGRPVLSVIAASFTGGRRTATLSDMTVSPDKDVSVKHVLESLDLGSSVAEHDKLLKQHFVETSTFKRLLDDQVDIVAGDKGTGKTAIFRILREQYAEYPQFQRVEVTAAFNPAGTPVFQRLLEAQTLAEDQYIAVWKVYLLSLAGNWMLNLYDGEFSDDMTKLDRLLVQSDLRSSDETPQTIFSKIVNRIKRLFPRVRTIEGTMTASADGMPILGAKFSFDDEAGNDFDTESVRPDDALKLLHDILRDDGTTLWLVIDRLDEAFQGHPELERPALRALFRTYLDMLDLSNLRIKLFVRRDLFARIIAGGFVNLTHINARRVDITWDDEDLKDLLSRRLRTSDQFINLLGAGDKDDDELFALVFPDQVDPGSRKPDTWTWITSRIRDANHVKPPRNLIDLVLKAREQQLKQEQRSPRRYQPSSERLIMSDALKRGLEALSNERVQDTLLAEAGNDAQLIELFRNGKAEHNLESLARLLGDNVDSKIALLETLGFLEATGSNYKIPILYRGGLNITQGKAFSTEPAAQE
jgi:hypothetical protein